jgi:hypothetical protein
VEAASPAAADHREVLGLATRIVIDTIISKVLLIHTPFYRQSVILGSVTRASRSAAPRMDGWIMRVGELLIPIAGCNTARSCLPEVAIFRPMKHRWRCADA